MKRLTTIALILAAAFGAKAQNADWNYCTPLQIIEACASDYAPATNNGKDPGVIRHQHLVVAHITDSHDDGQVLRRYSDFINTHDIIDFGIHTGDVIIPSYWTDLARYSDKKVYLTIGNHDGDQFNESGHFVKKLHDNFFPKDIVAKLGINLSEKNYYFVDNSDYEGVTIRFIFMNEYDYPDGLKGADMPKGANKFYNSVVSQEQIDWLIATLHECSEKGYYVVFVSHQKPAIVTPNDTPFFQRPQINISANNNYKGDIYGDIIDAYKHGKSLKKTYSNEDFLKGFDRIPEIKVDTKFEGEGHFIAFMNGHNHGDYIGYSSTHPDQLILNSNLAKSQRFVSAKSGKESLFSDLARSEDDETQDCYNVYVFDIKSAKVHVIRVGACLTKDMRIRKYWAYSF